MNPSDQSLESALFNERFVRRYAQIIVSVTCCVIAAHIVFVDLFPNFSEFLQRQFDLNGRAYVAQWFRDFVIYGTAGAIALLVAWLFYARFHTVGHRPILPWLLISGLFIYIGMYNNSFVHDALQDGVSGLLTKTNLLGTTSGAYRVFSVIVLRLPGILALLLMFRFFHANLWKNSQARQFVLLAVLLYFISMVGEIGRSAASSSLAPTITGEQLWLIMGASAGLFAGIAWTIGFLVYGIQILKETDTPVASRDSLPD